MVSIQMRGGPEPLMVTGWAQIMSLDPDYIGIYHCIATNTQGQVSNQYFRLAVQEYSAMHNPFKMACYRPTINALFQVYAMASVGVYQNEL